MKILMVTSWYPSTEQPHNGSFFREQSLMLSQAGNQVDVFGVSPVRFEQNKAWGKIVYDLDQGIGIYRQNVPMMPSYMHAIEHKRILRIAKNFARLYIRTRSKPEVIHAHSVFPAVLVAQELSRIWNIPYVLTEHRPSSIQGQKESLRRKKIRAAVKKASARISVAQEFSKALQQHYGGPEWVTQCLPVPNHFFEKEFTDRSQDIYRFCHVSHLDDNKRVVHTCRAFVKSFQNVPASLTIIGGSEARIVELKTVLIRENIPLDNIHFTGALSREQTADAMAQADFFVLASKYEAGGTVFSEAQAMGLLLLASKTWAGRSAISLAERNGVLAEVDDFEDLRSRFQELVLTSDFMGKAEIRDRARRLYSQKVFVSSSLQIYSEAIDAFYKPENGKSRTLIFHSQILLNNQGTTASQLRPFQMLDAFERLGYRIVKVSGSSRQRARQMRQVKKSLKDLGPICVYSELASMPAALSSSIKNGFFPLADFRFFWFCKRHGVPVGAFYRDIHWKFNPIHQQAKFGSYPWFARLFFRFDEKIIPRSVDVIFLPSLEMARYLPTFQKANLVALPPGAKDDVLRKNDGLRSEITTIGVGGAKIRPSDSLRLIYAGGIGQFYRLEKLIEAVREVPEVELYLYVHAEQWQAHNKGREVPNNVHIRHAYGSELQEAYRSADLGVLLVEPLEYWTFAQPYKLYEYIGNDLPILATNDTLAGRVVTEAEIGWAVEYDVVQIRDILSDLARDPSLISSKSTNVLRAKNNNSWLNRAQLAIDSLTASVEGEND